jgi:hypothetical protein
VRNTSRSSNGGCSGLHTTKAMWLVLLKLQVGCKAGTQDAAAALPD